GRELVSVDPQAATLELLELAGLELRAHRPELLAELRAKEREVRLHAELRRLDRPELDLLDAQLVADLPRVRLGGGRALHDEPAQRLAQLDPGLRARLAPELDHATNLRHLLEQRPVGRRALGPTREVHGIRPVGDEDAPEVVRQER